MDVARTGAGFGWHEHVSDVHEGCERFFRPGYNANLLSSWLPALDDVVAKLERAASVADVGCGHGSSTILMAAAVTEAIGLGAALFPGAWLGVFSHDPDVLAAGAAYLRIVGPVYGFFGLGLALYFASQGAGRLTWPIVGSATRLVVAGAGGWLVMRAGGVGLNGLFGVMAAALVIFGGIVAGAIALGAWEAGRTRRVPLTRAMESSHAHDA